MLRLQWNKMDSSSSFPVIEVVYDDPLGFVHAKFVDAQLQSVCEWKRQVKGQLPICCLCLSDCCSGHISKPYVYGSLRQLCKCFLVVLRGLVPDPTRNWNLIWHQIPDPNLFSHTRSSPRMFFCDSLNQVLRGQFHQNTFKLAWLESLRVVGNTLTMGRTLKHFQWQKPRYFHKIFFDRIQESWADTFLILSK